MTDSDGQSPPTARSRLERTVQDEVARLAAAFDLAFLQADRLLREQDHAGAAATMEHQRSELAEVEQRLQRAVSGAMVERAAEDVVAAELQRLEAPLAIGADPEQHDAPHAEGPRARLPALAAAGLAVVVALAALLTGPRDVDLAPVANQDVRETATSPVTDGATASERLEARPTAPAASASATSTGDAIGGTDPAPGPLPAPEIVALVDRVLAEATSNVFEEVARSPLLDEVAGDDLEAALDLLEQRLAEESDSPEPAATPSEGPSDDETPAPSNAETGAPPDNGTDEAVVDSSFSE